MRYRNASIPLYCAVTALGISHVITQITVIREFINCFAGNELVLGILISLWLLFSGLGAWLGRFVTAPALQTTLFRLSLPLVALFPIAHIVLIRLVRNVAFIPGELPAPGALFLWAALLLAPYCLVTGGLLTLACAVLPSREADGRSVGEVYFFDNIGDILGGLLFTFLLVRWMTNLDLLFVPALLCLAAALFIGCDGPSRRVRRSAPAVAGMLVLMGVMWLFPLDATTIRWLYPEQTILDYRESPYGRIVVTKDREQISFFENGGHLFSTPNIVESEEAVHFALLQRKNIDEVLLVAGGVGGTVREIMKYRPVRLDYVELDPEIIDAASRHLKDSFPREVHLHAEDGRRFVRTTQFRYDAVIVDLPDPLSLQLNRFYTVQFFREVRCILKPGGIFSFSVSGAEHYISPYLALFLSTIGNALKQVWGEVLFIPGERIICIASDHPLSADIAADAERRGIETVYVNERYLRGRVTDARVAFLRESLMPHVPANDDLHPWAYLYQMRRWLAQFQERHGMGLLVAAILCALYLYRIGMIQKTLFVTGFAASSIEVIILLCYQILHGSVYTGIGLIIAAFMCGLALGSWCANRRESVQLRSLLSIEVVTLCYLVMLICLLRWGVAVLAPGTLALLTIIAGALTGAEFPVAARLLGMVPQKAAGSLYAADLIGGSLGAVAVSLLLVPILGIVGTCLLVLLCKLLIVLGLVGTLGRLS